MSDQKPDLLECDICKDPNGTGPAIVLCEKHMSEAFDHENEALLDRMTQPDPTRIVH